MKKFARVLCMVLALIMIVSTLSVSTFADYKFKKAKIGVALYSDTGPAPESTKAFLSSLEKALNVKFSYTVLTQTDEAANLTKIQELIASGVNGIICTVDMGAQSILEECQAAGVYMAGYLCDYDTSFTTNYDNVFGNPYFLGTVADGNCSDTVTTGVDYFNSLLEYNERTPDAPILHVSMCAFPPYAFPQHQAYAQQFVECVEEYNKTAEQPITVDPLDMETDILQFKPMDSTYFSKHPGIDAVVSFCHGQFCYATMISAGKADTLKLFASGYGEGDSENFGTAGTGTFQQEVICSPESVIYPVVMLVNKLNGLEYADQPASAERINAGRLILNSDEDMAIFKNYLYLTYKTDHDVYTTEDVVNMTAANPDATYAGLVEAMMHLAVEDIPA